MRWRLPLMIMAVAGLLAAGFIGPANGAQTGQPPAEIATLSDQIGAFSRDLERLRRFMGVTEASQLDLGIRSALPRDLYYQSLILWKKTNRLLFEVARIYNKPSPEPSGDLELSDVLGRVQDAHQVLRQIMRHLQVTDADDTTPGQGVSTVDPFNAILAANRQLNLLLERHLSPSDVYEEITLAIGYSARLLARYPNATRIPVEPPFEPDKQPRDVYLRSIECLQSIVRIFDRLGLAVLGIDTNRTDLGSLQPSDVYLVASMIVAQLDFLHKYLGIAKLPPPSVYPGLKFPAHSYQRAGILRDQLQQLEGFLATDPAATTLPDPPKARRPP